ncbi:SDR family oxidoreductase [Chelativorans salis]|uniref:SDR family oxidoreductase n=1 Tax=Chelativorans salis TaxID=2978478 RepID=A0ABT2LIZ4_9HYPH|nr:SDR family oxidoreductase [Chelativorans sp. EGI FJ00035]MCT7374546.1 SDR family oxidoreductase [Chelativorans sp. EGI FJ00035]
MVGAHPHRSGVNAIGPGYVATPRMKEMGEEALAGLAEQHPLGRLAEPAEVADLTAFLLSDRAQFCTGAFYPLDGGYTAQ